MAFPAPITPINLTPEEIADPYIAIHRLFDYAHLVQLREALWQLLRTTVSGSFNSNILSGRERSDMLCLFEHLQKLIEAAHLLHTQNISTNSIRSSKNAKPNR